MLGYHNDFYTDVYRYIGVLGSVTYVIHNKYVGASTRAIRFCSSGDDVDKVDGDIETEERIEVNNQVK